MQPAPIPPSPSPASCVFVVDLVLLLCGRHLYVCITMNSFSGLRSKEIRSAADDTTTESN